MALLSGFSLPASENVSKNSLDVRSYVSGFFGLAVQSLFGEVFRALKCPGFAAQKRHVKSSPFLCFFSVFFCSFSSSLSFFSSLSSGGRPGLFSFLLVFGPQDTGLPVPAQAGAARDHVLLFLSPLSARVGRRRSPSLLPLSASLSLSCMQAFKITDCWVTSGKCSATWIDYKKLLLADHSPQLLPIECSGVIGTIRITSRVLLLFGSVRSMGPGKWMYCVPAGTREDLTRGHLPEILGDCFCFFCFFALPIPVDNFLTTDVEEVPLSQPTCRMD